ncbi:MAG: hypothetical protein D6812_07465 [Deltaproteobacteria bacterium]|nr:MAG: hypothetical protein D6812_07465 [Deltaproteobacteria bacterium]
MNDVSPERSEILDKHSKPGSYQQTLFGRPRCDICPLRFKIQAKKYVLPSGPVPADIAIVGEGPGHNEEQRGIGFCGKSGVLLWDHLLPRALERLGRNPKEITRRDVWVSNAALCRPEPVRIESGYLMPKDEVKAVSVKCCRPRLIEELRAVNPKVIIPVGTLALRSITGIEKAKITSFRGTRTVVDL